MNNAPSIEGPSDPNERAIWLAQRYARWWRGKSRGPKGTAEAWRLIMSSASDDDLFQQAKNGNSAAYLALEYLTASDANQNFTMSPVRKEFMRWRIENPINQVRRLATNATNIDIVERQRAVGQAVDWIVKATGVAQEGVVSKPGKQSVSAISAVAKAFNMSFASVKSDHRSWINSKPISIEEDTLKHS
jgi:hypothetical protein